MSNPPLALEAKKSNICGARTGTGSMCARLAGEGTDHFGSGRCFIHGMRDSGLGYAKILQIIARDPDLADRANAYLNSDRELLNARRELSTLKARFELITFDEDLNTDIPHLVKLANTISLMTKRIQDIEIGRKHYIHIDVLTRFVSDFSRIGQQFLPDPSERERFLDTLESDIRQTISKSNARGIAARLMTKDAKDIIVDVDDYDLLDEDELPSEEQSL